MGGTLVSTRAACAGVCAAECLLLGSSQNYCPHMVDPWSQLLFAAFLFPNPLRVPVCPTLPVGTAWGRFHTHLLTPGGPCSVPGLPWLLGACF